MLFDPDNPVIRLCAQGMELEVKGEADKAKKTFYEAWNNANTATEKCAAAHYVARHQDSVAAKLEWDERSLNFALELQDQTIYPSLYLNIAKCHEDLEHWEQAMANYKLALVYAEAMPTDGYGQMIKPSIEKGIARVGKHIDE